MSETASPVERGKAWSDLGTGLAAERVSRTFWHLLRSSEVMSCRVPAVVWLVVTLLGGSERGRPRCLGLLAEARDLDSAAGTEPAESL